MKMYIIRLDDASEHMEITNWMRMKELLDRYGVKPIFGIIPKNQDPDLLAYSRVSDFWKIAYRWQEEGWIPALHGFTHEFFTREGGINPVNFRSEFAGLSLEQQRLKIRKGYETLKKYGIKADVFFAPAHTFDRNTLKALYIETPIRVISDTVANDIYFKEPFYFVPQQSGQVRRLPFKVVTFCYHPNILTEAGFINLEKFLKKNQDSFTVFSADMLIKREKGFLDKTLSRLYFAKKKFI